MAGMTGKPPTALIVPLTEADPLKMLLAMSQAVEQGADMVELRLDYLERPDAHALAQLLSAPPLPVVATCRPVRQGGRYSGPEEQRLALLQEASRLGANYIDVEDDVPPGDRPQGQIILSHHDFTGQPRDWRAVMQDLAAQKPAVVKLAFTAGSCQDAIEACRLVRDCPLPAMVLAMGEAGILSRVLARKFGAFGSFAALSADQASAPGQLTLSQMKQVFRWDHIGPATKVYGVVACPVAHSMSPAVHNAAFGELGVDAVYLPLRVEPSEEAFDDFLDAVLAAPWLELGGLSVTVPHKEHALARVGPEKVDRLSRAIGAINTVRIGQGGQLEGFNTDYAAALESLCQAMGIEPAGLAGKSVGVLGAGGVARAVVAALTHYKAIVTIYNRTLSRAEELAERFGGQARPADAIPVMEQEIVINCTSVGMHPRVGDTPAPLEALRRSRVVFDTIYNPPTTRLLELARQAGCITVGGLDMFVRQAAMQFEIWTGRPAPQPLMRQVMADRLEANRS